MAAIRYGLAFLQGARHPSTLAGVANGAFIVAQHHGVDIAKTCALIEGKEFLEEKSATLAKEKLRYLIEDRNWVWMSESDLHISTHGMGEPKKGQPYWK